MSPEIHDYVRATARFLELPLDEGQIERVAAHLDRTRTMVAALLAEPLRVDAEPAEIFCPAPFPPAEVE